jgi:AcrR family transcriptional regulator
MYVVHLRCRVNPYGVYLSSVIARSAVRSRLDRDTVVASAFGIADVEGLDALTIRRLAKDLGVTPMALYWHFADKQALLDALADQIWTDARAAIDASPPLDDPWDELRVVLDSLVASFRRHPELAPLAPTRVTDSVAGLEITERTLALLDGVGYEPRRAADLARFALCAAIMLVSNHPGGDVPDGVEALDHIRHKKAGFAALPPDRYPHIARALDYLIVCDDPEDHFAGGVDLIIDGMKAQVLVDPGARRRA